MSKCLVCQKTLIRNQSKYCSKEHRFMSKNNYNKKYYEQNKEIFTKKQKERYVLHKEEILLHQKQYRQKNIKQIREKAKLRSKTKTYQETRVKWLKGYNKRDNVKQKKKVYNQKYRHSERGKLSEVISNWRKQTKNNSLQTPMQITINDLEKIQQQYSSCAYCWAKEELTFEHIISIKQQGQHTKENIIICCKKCNSSKQDRTLLNWFTLLYCKRKNINLQTIHPYVQQYYLGNLNQKYSEMKL